ncbi:MAG: type II and III secretion system protein family protein [Noviherbaspirillum sp.]
MKRKKNNTARGTSLMLAAGMAIALPLGVHAQPAAESAVLAQVAPRADAPKPGKKAPAAKAEAAAPSRGVATPVCVGEMAPAASVNLPEGKSGQLDLQKLHLPAPAWLRTIGNQEVVQVEPTTSPTPRSMFFVFGKRVGSTNLMFQTKEGRCAMVEVSVGVDTAAVQEKLTQLLPAEKNIRIGAAADSLVLTGTVADAMVAERALMIATAYVRKGGGAQAGGEGGGMMPASQNGGKGSERIVNMLSIAAPQQVMLEVKVAEISKTLLDKLGVNLAAINHVGDWTASLLSNFQSDANGILAFTKSTTGERVILDAEKKDGLVKILAEPTVMAISGQEGSFLAGGKIFIPVEQDISGRITLEEKEFGVGLKFTPTVLEGGRINLKVAPEVSELSREGVGITSTGFAGRAILPLITTRRAATTVQLFDGQSFAIGGLIKNNVTQNIKALPILGEIPVLGALFRSSDFQTDKTELVFVVTPRLVKALPPDYALPTDRYVEPSRSEFFLGGKMEGAAPPKTVSPAAPQTSAPQRSGPSGFELK